MMHRETTNTCDVPKFVVPALTGQERKVLAAAREYYRLDGDVDAHNELMDAVQQLERAYLNSAIEPDTCYCGTGRGHSRGEGYHCRPAPPEETP